MHAPRLFAFPQFRYELWSRFYTHVHHKWNKQSQGVVHDGIWKMTDSTPKPQKIPATISPSHRKKKKTEPLRVFIIEVQISLKFEVISWKNHGNKVSERFLVILVLKWFAYCAPRRYAEYNLHRTKFQQFALFVTHGMLDGFVTFCTYCRTPGLGQTTRP